MTDPHFDAPVTVDRLNGEARENRGPTGSRLRIQLDPDAPIQHSLLFLLEKLRKAFTANIPGVVEDDDPEYLHCLRVGIRRTRTAIAQIPAALPKDRLQHFKDELRWIGAITGPCRDLDVCFDEIQKMPDVASPSSMARLHGVFAEARRERDFAAKRVAKALKSTRFEEFSCQWRGFLKDSDHPDPPPPKGRKATLKVARARLAKAHERVVKRCSALDRPPAVGDLHRLRIDCKKLRYLLEFFESLTDEDQAHLLIKHLKGLQDILGESNDCAVHEEILELLGHQAITKGRAPRSALVHVAQLSASIEERRQEVLTALPHRISEFLSHRLP